MEIPHDTIINDKEILTEKYNIWRDELMTRLASWKQVELDKKREPGKVVVNQEGKKIYISQVVKARKNLVREAVQYVQVFKELLNAFEAGTLEGYWSEEELKEPLILENAFGLPVRKEE